MPRRIESHLLDGPTGKLEALLEAPEDAEPRALAVVCHPHPLFGGTMHNKVVYRVARALRSSGHAVLRFNFRGVSKSEGQHDEGAGEIEDARAALDWLRNRYPGLPYTLAGFSFGGRVALNLACSLADVERVIALGFPAKLDPVGMLAHCAIPKIFIQSTHDEFGPPPEMQAFFAQVAEPKRLIWIAADDHFFAGGLDELERQVAALG
ncbi:MAG TPA: alpha/beta fold hydrolase [Bryobacteraceae bacterium]|nr:alpha/beta fold hydrolase [Bryobacteraceae bacterium]